MNQNLLKVNTDKYIKVDFGKGFDESNLRYMRLFYSSFPIRDALRHELSWTHYRLLLKVDNESPGNSGRVIQAATLKLQEPITQRISHHHHLKAGMILSIFFCMLFIFCIGGLYLTYQKANAYEEGAYKYEYLWLTVDKNSSGYLKKNRQSFWKE